MNHHAERSALRRLLNTLSLRPTERRVLLAALGRQDETLRARSQDYARRARRALASKRTSQDGRALAAAVLDLLGEA